MLFGYAGNMLMIDLTNETTRVLTLREEWARKYLGGSGLAARIIYEYMPRSIDPLDPESLLVFAVGPLTGTPFPQSGRYAVAARSPLTGIWGEARSGDMFGPELKKAGYDAIVISGACDSPRYIYIKDSDVYLKDASKYWRKGTRETIQMIRKDENDNKLKVVTIGLAGENLVKFASIVSDMGVAGRTGMGAVMGAKKLKAIAIRGTGIFDLANKEEFRKKALEIQKRLSKSSAAEIFDSYGTGSGLMRYYTLGNIPIKNFGMGTWDLMKVESITGQALSRTIKERSYSCSNCVLKCKKIIHIKEGRYSCLRGRGPEYETLCMLGSNLLNSDLNGIAAANYLCDEYGMDTISTGSVIAFAMEAYERGFLTKQDAGGLELKWGDSDVIIELIRRIANREDIGNILAEGVRRASEEIGRDSWMFAVHVKGLEQPAHDGRAFFDHALSFATMNRGACHLAWPHLIARGREFPELGLVGERNRFEYKESGKIVKTMQDLMEVVDSSIFCKYAFSAGLRPIEVSEMLSLATGWDIDVQEMMQIGERIFNLKRLLNVEWGITGEDDRLPPRSVEPLEGGTNGNVPPLDIMLKEYYELRGWTEEGRPSDKKLRELGIP